MTERERVLAAIRGETSDRVPWVPRLDFWHRAALRKGTVPQEWRGLSVEEIAVQLGAGIYATNPNYQWSMDKVDRSDRGLGLTHFPVQTYEFELDGVERRVSKRPSEKGTETVVEYVTPVGVLETAFLMTEEMLDAGTSTAWVSKPPICKPEDFEPAGYLFEHIKVHPRMDGYLTMRRKVGEHGVVVAPTLGSAGPMHHIMKQMMFPEQFFYAMADYPEKVYRLAGQMEPFFQAIQESALDSPAEVVYFGGNYDDSLTPPPLFRKHILPVLKQYAERLHKHGKYLLTHTDGENRRLIPLYLEAGFDIADSVCPYPMTQVTLEQIHAAFASRITIWGGIPATQLCPASTDEVSFRRYVDELIERYGHAKRIILGVSDMVTADADISRLKYLNDRILAIC
jgi:uroporphyrinogen-III decarboxylase